MKRSFPIDPSTNMMEVLGHSGYTFDAAIADIIDNSISAHAKNIIIYFDVLSESPYLYVLDDGDGMDNAKLHECIIPAFRNLEDERNEDDLGRYSLGLKSAAKSLCEQLYVCSRERNKVDAHTVELDFKHISESKKWEAFEISDYEHCDLLEANGTLVFLENLKIKNNPNVLDAVSRYDIFEKLEISLSHIFGKYILEDGLNLWMQSSGSSKKTKIAGWNPFELPNDKSTMTVSEEPLKIQKEGGGEFTVAINSYILPTFSTLSQEDQKYMTGKGLIEQQGFYIYRNKRLIQEGGWLDLEGIKADQKCNYARISVDIGTNLDKEFGVNFSKNKVIIPQELTAEFIRIAKYARLKSKSSFDYLKNPETKRRIKKDQNIVVWKTFRTAEGLKLTINPDHPIIRSVFSKLPVSDVRKITGLIEKTIPINFIQTQGGTEVKYDKTDIQALIKETYETLKEEESDITVIKKKVFKIEPFNFYSDELIEFFTTLEENADD